MLYKRGGINETQEKIINAATRLFGDKGYSSTSIKDICEEAGISKGGLFYYFDSKEAILYVIHDIFIDYEIREALKIIDQEKSPREILYDLVVCQVESIGKYRSYVRVFYREKDFFSHGKFTEIKAKRNQYENMFVEVIKAGIQCGEFRHDMRPELIVKFIFGICNWTYLWMDPNGLYTPKEIGEMIFKIIYDGIR